MAGRIVSHEGHFHHVGGRRRPEKTPASHPHLFKDPRKFVRGPLPPVPDSFDYTSGVAAVRDILGNDRWGDCTAAGAWHLEEVFSASGGAPVVATLDQCLGFYSLSTGYQLGSPPGSPSDQGGDEVSVLDYWQQHGLDGQGAHRIVGRLAPDPNDWALCRYLVWLFENGYCGSELPPEWEQVGGNDFVWDVASAPNPEAGHCYVVGGSPTVDTLRVISWGLLGSITKAALAKYCAQSAYGNFFVLLTPEIINRAIGKSPTGFDWHALVTAFNAEGGDLPGDMPLPEPGQAAPPPQESWLQRLENFFEGEYQKRASGRIQNSVRPPKL